MDFEALHKMCRNCPRGLWELMVRCCQIDPDERPQFDEAVKILEQTRVLEEREGRREEEELRTCFSEPLLRLQDSDDNVSYTSGQSSSSHILQPITSSDSLDNYSANGLGTGRHHLEQEPKASVTTEETDGSKNDDVFEDATSEEAKQEKQLATILTTAPLENEGRTSYGQLESDEEGTNKGDSGIDPGEMFVAPVISPSDDVRGNQMSLSSCSKQDKSMWKEPVKQIGAVQSLTEGDTTPPGHCSPNSHAVFFLGQPQSSETHLERTHPDTAIAAPPMFRSPSNDLVPPTTPHRCCSPSTASNLSLFVPNPSTPWAPPPSPLRSNSYRLSSSLPSSPTIQYSRPFRFSMDVQEALFPPFDPSTFFSPSSLAVGMVDLRSTPKSASKSKRRSLRHSCGHNTPLPTFPEDLETRDHSLCSRTLWTGEAEAVDLDRERYPGYSQFPRRRARSASNPTPLPPPPQPPHFTLNLARYSPCSASRSHSTAGGSSATFFKYYTIIPCFNCRLSSSEPNLVTRLSATRLV
ncbi:hypothetical protein GBAR_LOCUS15088 [Geodia barretti]|nr:hypothetical protein GBAR_LOCUS15088 [Geodia barretti]